MKDPQFRHPPGSMLDDFAELLRHPWGRRIAFRLVHEYGLLHHASANLDPSLDGPSRALLTYHVEGARTVARAIAADMQRADAAAYAQMAAEWYEAAMQTPNE